MLSFIASIFECCGLLNARKFGKITQFQEIKQSVIPAHVGRKSLWQFCIHEYVGIGVASIHNVSAFTIGNTLTDMWKGSSGLFTTLSKHTCLFTLAQIKISKSIQNLSL